MSQAPTLSEDNLLAIARTVNDDVAAKIDDLGLSEQDTYSVASTVGEFLILASVRGAMLSEVEIDQIMAQMTARFKSVVAAPHA